MEVVDLDSDSDTDLQTLKNQVMKANDLQRTARKSTAAIPISTPTTNEPIKLGSTRRQTALANSREKMVEVLQNSNQRYLENFNPDNSVRERRKLNKKVTQSIQNNVARKHFSSVYDENGIHIATGIDMCDCLKKNCPGCFFPCPKCNSTKCGIECRVNRKFVYEQIEYQGCDVIVKNPLT